MGPYSGKACGLGLYPTHKLNLGMPTSMQRAMQPLKQYANFLYYPHENITQTLPQSLNLQQINLPKNITTLFCKNLESSNQCELPSRVFFSFLFQFCGVGWRQINQKRAQPNLAISTKAKLKFLGIPLCLVTSQKPMSRYGDLKNIYPKI